MIKKINEIHGQTVESIELATYNGTTRVYTYDILLGNDGVNWDQTVAGIKTSGQTDQLEKFEIPPRDAKFVRIVGHGNTTNDWVHIVEARINIKVTIPPIDPPPIDPPPVVVDEIDIVRQGYYLVLMDGVQQGGGHSEYDKAVEKAVNLLLKNGTSNILIQAPTWRVEY